MTGTRSLLLLQEIQTSQYSEYNIMKCLSPHRRTSNIQTHSSDVRWCALTSIRLCWRGWHCIPQSILAHKPRLSSTADPWPLSQLFLLQHSCHKSSSSLPPRSGAGSLSPGPVEHLPQTVPEGGYGCVQSLQLHCQPAWRGPFLEQQLHSLHCPLHRAYCCLVLFLRGGMTRSFGHRLQI